MDLEKSREKNGAQVGVARLTDAQARALGLSRYFGKVCAKHPELEGERWVGSHNCVGGHKETNPRIQAKVQKLKRYFGKVCAKHPELRGERWTDGCRCVGCGRDKDKKRVRTPAQRARRNAADRARHARTKEHRAALRLVWYAQPENRQRKLASQKNWRDQNKEWCRAYGSSARHARRARKRGAPGRWTLADIERIHQQQNGICAAPHCDTPVTVRDHKDHIIPLARGGTNWPENIQILCQPCNDSKGKRTMEEWMAWLDSIKAAS
jgi:5-methylcytosine-specific restriction endonuclease McrA